MAEGIVVKGIEPYRTKKLFDEFVIEGQYKFSSKRANEILLSQDIAKKNNLTIGSKVFLYSLSKDDIINNKLPNIEAYKIKGIFNTGFSQYDNSVCYIPKEKAAEFFKMDKNSCSQIDLYLKDLEKTESFSAEIDNKLGYPFYTVNIFNLHSSIFNWIEFQREPIPIILGLISLVAVFNIVSILLITIIEKIQTIGILKSLGMSNFDIRFIFIRQGLKTAIYGIIFGCGFALALLFAQKEFSIIKLDPEIYYLDKVPVTIELWHYPLVIIVVLLMTLFASLIPSVIASKITPTRAMRFR
jgi:lipoprotein-releasing system permease protein